MFEFKDAVAFDDPCWHTPHAQSSMVDRFLNRLNEKIDSLRGAYRIDYDSLSSGLTMAKIEVLKDIVECIEAAKNATGEEQ